MRKASSIGLGAGLRLVMHGQCSEDLAEAWTDHYVAEMTGELKETGKRAPIHKSATIVGGGDDMEKVKKFNDYVRWAAENDRESFGKIMHMLGVQKEISGRLR